MTTGLLLLSLIAAALSAPAGSPKPPVPSLQLGYQMQEAVLKSQDTGKVEALLKQGVDINAPIGCGTFSPLDGAVSTQNVRMLKFLLAHGAKPRGRELARAAFAGGFQQSLEMVKALLKGGADPDFRNERGETAATLAEAEIGKRQAIIVKLKSASK